MIVTLAAIEDWDIAAIEHCDPAATEHWALAAIKHCNNCFSFSKVPDNSAVALFHAAAAIVPESSPQPMMRTRSTSFELRQCAVQAWREMGCPRVQQYGRAGIR
jgi:hypothetical protein